MLHGEWALMNIIIMRGREALRPKQAFYLYLSLRQETGSHTVYTYVTLQICTCFIALTNKQEINEEKIGEEWVWEAKKGQNINLFQSIPF